MLPPNRADLTAESLAPLVAQVGPWMAILYALEFSRTRLADRSRIESVRVDGIGAAPPTHRDADWYTDGLPCDCRFTGDTADASGCDLHRITSRPVVADMPEWRKDEPCPF